MQLMHLPRHLERDKSDLESTTIRSKCFIHKIAGLTNAGYFAFSSPL